MTRRRREHDGGARGRAAIVLAWLAVASCAAPTASHAPALDAHGPRDATVSTEREGDPGRTSRDAEPTRTAAAPEGVRIAGLMVHDGPRASLSAVQRAYLVRLEHVLDAYANAPLPPASYAADPGAWTQWSYDTLRPAFAGLDDETRRLVREHPRAPDESDAERRFHVLLVLIEAERAALFYEVMSGGPPGHPGCPHDPPSQLAALLTQLVHHADVCLESTSVAGPAWADTAAECARRGQWARARLAEATPPAPDECLEDMPSPGD